MIKMVLFLAALTMCSRRSWGDTVAVVGPLSSPSVGDTFTVDVNIVGVTDLYAFQFDLLFNPTLLKAVNINEGAFLPAGGSTYFVPGTINYINGTVTGTLDTLLGPIQGITGDGTLAMIQFTALAPGVSALSLQNLTLLNSTLSDITPVTVQDGLATINGAATVPEPSTISMVLCAVAAPLLIYVKRRLSPPGCGRRSRFDR